MFKYLALLIFIVPIRYVDAQEFFHATILDSISKEPVKYVNIKIKETNKGTISNFEGQFRLVAPEGIKSDIIISHLNYYPKTIYLEKLSDTVFLSPRIYVLNEVVLDNYAGILKNALSSHEIKEDNQIFQKFYFKQYLKQNEEYVDYLEAIGVRSFIPTDFDVFIESARAKEAKIKNYVNVIHPSIYTHLNYISSAKLIKEGTIKSTRNIDDNLIEYNILYKGEKIKVVVDVNSNSISKMSFKGINEQLSESTYSKKIRSER